MKLYATDNSELMNVTKIRKDGRNLVIDGTIMGAMPIRAVVKPEEVRRVFGVMGPKAMFAAFMMLFQSSR